ncbi:MAG: hypothetical protein RL406_1427, partial [Pseudomonadota bacterium]|jgi:hypothetical protein
LWQWVATAIHALVCIVGGEVKVQVSVLCACDVLRYKLCVACGRVHQIEGAVKHGQRRAVGLQGLELRNRDECGEHVGFLEASIRCK